MEREVLFVQTGDAGCDGRRKKIYCHHRLHILFWGETVKIKYDPQVDAAYISFKQGSVPVTTVRLNEDIAIDLGANEEIVGIEILDASEHLELKNASFKLELENLKVV